jgi:hypothetical protein
MENNYLKEDFQYVLNKMENEGIGYYIMDYTDSKDKNCVISY